MSADVAASPAAAAMAGGGGDMRRPGSQSLHGAGGRGGGRASGGYDSDSSASSEDDSPRPRLEWSATQMQASGLSMSILMPGPDGVPRGTALGLGGNIPPKVKQSRTRKWLKMIHHWDKYHETSTGLLGALPTAPWKQKKVDKLKRRVRKGIPDIVRRQAWSVMVGLEQEMAKEPELYKQMCAAEDQRAFAYEIDIEGDLQSALYGHVLFNRHSDGPERLRRVALAYAKYDPDVGYKEGVGLVLATLLCYLSEEEAFHTLRILMDRFPGPLRGLYTNDQPLAKEMMAVGDALVQKFLPQLWQHFETNQMHYSVYLEDWFVPVLSKGFAPDVVGRVWDSFLHEGLKVVYRIQLALLKTHHDELLKLDLPSSVRYLKELPSRVDRSIIDTAFALSLSHSHIEAARAAYQVRTVSGEEWAPPETPPTLQGEARHGAAGGGGYDSDSSDSSMGDGPPNFSRWGLFGNSVLGPMDGEAGATLKSQKDKWNELTPQEKERTRKWFKMISNWHKYNDKKAEKLKRRVRKGIPDVVRRQAWGVMVHLKTEMAKDPSMYAKLRNAISTGDQVTNVDLEQDIQGPLQGHYMFAAHTDGPDRLRRVVRAYLSCDPEVTYSQGLGFVGATLLNYFTEEEAFYVLRAVMGSYPGPIRGLYTAHTPLAQEMMAVGEALVSKFLPPVWRHLQSHQFQHGEYAREWYTSVFSGKGFPQEVVGRVWDAFLHEGLKVIYRLHIAVLKTHQKELLRLDASGLAQFLSDLPSRVDPNILDVAFGLSLSHSHIEAAKADYQVRAMSGQAWTLPAPAPVPGSSPSPSGAAGGKKGGGGYDSDSSASSDGDDASISGEAGASIRAQRERWNGLSLTEKQRCRKWLKMINNFNKYNDKKADKLKRRIRKGIPDIVRRQAWGSMVNLKAEMGADPEAYHKASADSASNSHAHRFDADIEADVSGALSGHVMLQRHTDGQERLKRVLEAHAHLDPDLAYSHGLAFVTATLLTHFTEEEAFYMLGVLLKRFPGPLRDMYLFDMPLTREMVAVGDALVRKFLPQLWRHFKATNVEHGTYAQDWYTSVFSGKGFHPEVTGRVWDAFLHEGLKVIYRLHIAVLKTHQKELLRLDAAGLVRFLDELPGRVEPSILDAAFALSLSHSHIEGARADYQVRAIRGEAFGVAASPQVRSANSNNNATNAQAQTTPTPTKAAGDGGGGDGHESSDDSDDDGASLAATDLGESFRSARERWNELTPQEKVRTRKWLKMINKWNKYQEGAGGGGAAGVSGASTVGGRVAMTLSNVRGLWKEKKTDKLKRRIRKGIPDLVRRQAWGVLVDVKGEMARDPELFHKLSMDPNPSAIDAATQAFDIEFQGGVEGPLKGHLLFQRSPEGQDRLRRVLLAYARLDPEVGYNTGLAFVAAMLLTHFTDEEAFYVLRGLMKRSHDPVRELYLPDPHLAKEMVAVVDILVRQFMPQLSRHFQTIQLDLGTYTTDWIVPLLTKGFTPEVTGRVWDAFLHSKGLKVIYRVVLALLKTHQKDLLRFDAAAAAQFLKDLPGRVDPSIVDAAFAMSLSYSHIEQAQAEFQCGGTPSQE